MQSMTETNYININIDNCMYCIVVLFYCLDDVLRDVLHYNLPRSVKIVIA